MSRPPTTHPALPSFSLNVRIVCTALPLRPHSRYRCLARCMTIAALSVSQLTKSKFSRALMTSPFGFMTVIREFVIYWLRKKPPPCVGRCILLMFLGSFCLFVSDVDNLSSRSFVNDPAPSKKAGQKVAATRALCFLHQKIQLSSHS